MIVSILIMAAMVMLLAFLCSAPQRIYEEIRHRYLVRRFGVYGAMLIDISRLGQKRRS